MNIDRSWSRIESY